jgi:hypothetical protein
MLRQQDRTVLSGKDFNCAESCCLPNDEYGLCIRGSLKLVGLRRRLRVRQHLRVLSAGVSASGCSRSPPRPRHRGLRELCTAYVNAFKDKRQHRMRLGGKKQKTETRCLETVLVAADTLERVLTESDFPKAKASS